jgi:formate dehydrogenase alpha subunit
VSSLGTVFGSGAMTNSIEELSKADVIFVIGSNTTEQHPLVGTRIIEAVKKNDAKIIIADPRQIPLVQFSSIYAPLIPGTNLALINGMLNVIVSEGLEDIDFIQSRTEGYEEFKQAIKKYTPEWTEEVTGVDAETIREMARLYAGAKNASIVYAMGITQHITGSKNVAALANLAMITGHIGKENSGLNPLRGQNNVQGACDMGALPDILPGYQPLGNEASIERLSKVWGNDFESKRGLTVTQMMDEAIEGKMKAFYIVGENPVLSDSDINHVKHALKSAEFVVVQDIFMTETAQMANVILPAASSLEKDGTFTNTERRVQRVRKAIRNVGDSLEDWRIIQRIINAMGCDVSYNSPSDIMEEIRRVVPQYGGITYDRIEKEGIQWPCPDVNHPGTKTLHKGKFTRGLGKITINEYMEPSETPNEKFPLVLTTGRTQHHYHTGTMTRRSWALDREQPNGFIEINPEDAKNLGIRDHSRVKVSSPRGEIITNAYVTDKITKGIVFMPMHFGEQPVNKLTSRNLDEIAGIPELKVCTVNVEVVK